MTNLQDLQQELWKDIPGYEGFYKASTLGRIKSLPRIKVASKLSYLTKERILIPDLKPNGYESVTLSKDRIKFRDLVHRIVLRTFEDRSNYSSLYANHKNGIRNDNRLINLEWVTQSENVNYAWKQGRIKQIGSANPHSKGVIQMDANENILNTFESLSEAQNKTGIYRRFISLSCNGKEVNAGGFIWKFKEAG